MNSIYIHTIFLSKKEQASHCYVCISIPAKLVNMCRLTLADTKSLVKVDNAKLEPLITTKGLRQGDSLSCDIYISKTYYISS